MDKEQLYIGIRHAGLWRMLPIFEVTDRALDDVDVLHDVQCTWTLGADPDAAFRQVSMQAVQGLAPFSALEHATEGIAVLCRHLARAAGAAAREVRTDGVRSRYEATSPAMQQAQAQAEHEQTDDSLRIERAQVDLAFEQDLVVINETTDALIRAARERIDAVRAHRAARLEGDRKDTDESLRRERAGWAETMATRDEVLAIAGHELRNMLTAAIGFADAIAGAAERAQYDQVPRYAQNIRRAGARMERLVGDLVDAARIAAGGLTMKREVGDLTEVVAEAVDAFRLSAAARRVSVTMETMPSPPRVLLDSARMLQVLVNLLSNALKFTPTCGRVAVRIEQVGTEIRCDVTDTGPGVPVSMLDAIFERYRQVAPADNRGLGIGLYIAKGIVQGHGGKIWARSEAGQGTTVSLTLPVAL